MNEQHLNEQHLCELLSAADRATAPPTYDADPLAMRVRRRARRRRRAVSAGGIGVVVLIAAGVLSQPWRGARSTDAADPATRMVAGASPMPAPVRPDDATRSVGLTGDRAAIDSLRRDAEFQRRMAGRLRAARRIDGDLSRARRVAGRQGASWTTAEAVNDAAFVLVYQSDQLTQRIGPTDAARRGYEGVVRHLNGSRWASVARQRLAASP
jgi:hypothetical protein